ncbi:MAG: glucose 1-dehydrogenase [Alphaproteobacteria bacterium]|nr:glucose 1-dehydrogenase [Alphaproteobacteria bacterium]
MFKLDGKVAIVTGATSGIGVAIAEKFVEAGAKVVIAGRRKVEGEDVAKRLGVAVRFKQTDVTDEAQMKTLIDEAFSGFGRLDCIVNNAGGPGPVGSIETIPVDGFDACVALNCRSVMLGMKLTAPIFRKQRSGSIINVGSIAALRAGFSSSMVYSMAKAGVVHLTKVVAMELAEVNVRVNSISPGAIATGIFGKALGAADPEKTADVAKQVLAKAQPIPRAGVAEDIAGAAVFLASDESSFITAHDIVIDGGMIGGRFWTAQQEGLNNMRKAFGVAAS